MSLCAIIPVAQMIAANDALEADGFGPENFSVPSYTGANATHGSLHSWNDAAFEAAVIALPGVVTEVGDGDPVTRTNDMIVAEGAAWGATAPPLPTTGDAVAGVLYSYDTDQLWYCIQTFDRTTFPLPPSNYPALIRQARIPGTAIPWKQPIDQFDAYKLVNAFTGEGDLCTHNGSTWAVTQADGAGNNIWEPGVFGWTQQP